MNTRVTHTIAVLMQVWAALGILNIGLIAAAPHLLPTYPPQSLAGVIGSALIALNLGGFAVVMVADCIFSQRVRHRFLWLPFLFFVPIFSAYIYFWVTRSALYAGSSE